MSFQDALIEHLTLTGQKFNSCHAADSGRFCGTGATGGGLGIAHEAEISKGIGDVQAHGLSTGNEAVVSYDKQGKRINGMLTGSKDEISDVSGILTNKSYVFVHNHPSSASFGGADVHTFLTSPPQHMIVVGHDGTLYKLSKPDKWKPQPGKNYRKDWSKIKDSPMAAKYQHRASKGENLNKIWKEQTHEIMTKFASDYQLDYTRVLPEG